MQSKKTVVIGASPNTSRYSNKAVRLLERYNHEVVPIGIRKGKINDCDIVLDRPAIHDVDTVTLYVGPQNQPPYFDYILSLNPKRIIFNPGTENDELAQLAMNNGIEVVENCTLVMLHSDLY
jgi:predicted CoA-binding protein